MRHYIALLAFLIAFSSADRIPEFKVSASYKALRQLELDIIKPLAPILLQDVEIPFNIDVTKKIPVLGELHLKATNLKLISFGLDWETTSFRPFWNSENEMYLDLEKFQLKVSADLFVQVGKWKLLDTNTQVTIANLTQTLLVEFQETDSASSWGFIPLLKESSTNIDRVSVHFAKSKIPDHIATFLLDMIVPFVPRIARSLIVEKLGPKLAHLAGTTPIAFKLPLKLPSEYEISVSATQAPRSAFSKDDAALNIALNLGIKNLNTGQECPLFNEGVLADRVYQNYPDLELILGDNLVNQLLWLVTDAKIIDLYITQEQVAKVPQLPLVLTTTGLKLITPAFADKYGEQKAMYLHVSTTTANPEVYFRSGRIVGALTVRIEFIVDTDSSLQPLPFAECKTCESAHVADAQLSLMLTAFNIAERTLGASLMEVLFNDMTKVESKVNLDDKLVASIFNSLLNAFVPQINTQIKGGYPIPYIEALAVKELDVVLGDTFLVAALAFE